MESNSSSEMIFLRIVTLLILYAIGEASENSSNIDKHPSWSWIPTDSCGKQAVRARIIGGDEAKQGQFPWLARLGTRVIRNRKLNVRFTCGGALITQFYVLSAAHCGTAFDVVRLGETHVETRKCNRQKCGQHSQDFSIDNFFLDLYDNDTHLNDIMLILLKKPVQFNGFIFPVCLPRGEILDKNYEGKLFEIAGWGLTDPDVHKLSKKLFYVSAPILNNDECDRIYDKPLTKAQYCVGLGKGKDSCTGDSGGPMTRAVEIDNDERTYIFGIVSYGVPRCGTAPAVYTNVGSYMSWILDHITKH